MKTLIGSFMNLTPRGYLTLTQTDSISDLPAAWQVQGTVSPQDFNWFDLEHGAGEHATELLKKWLLKALKHQEDPLLPEAQEAFDFDRLGMAELDDDIDEAAAVCAECGKGGANLVCVWCNETYYCNIRCKLKNGEQHLAHPGSTCPGPSGETRAVRDAAKSAGVDISDATALASFAQQLKQGRLAAAAGGDEYDESQPTEMQMISTIIERISSEFYNGTCDPIAIETLIQKLQDDDWLSLRCRHNIDFLINVQDRLREEGIDFDPMSLMWDVEGEVEAMPDYDLEPRLFTEPDE
jgi:hypothetical protein